MPIFFQSFSIPLAFVACFILLKLLPGKNRILGKDRGKKFVIGSEINKGKPTGVGIYFIVVFLLVSLSYIYDGFGMILILLTMAGAMVSGYLDDIASTPWNEYKKGALDLIVAFIGSVFFVVFYGSDVSIGFNGNSIYIHPAIYILLGSILIIVSINSTNATDGVDGLSGSLSIASILTIMIVSAITGNCTANGFFLGFIMIAVLSAYLMFNIFPSKMMMGDAGSRSIGFFIAFYAMYMKIPFAYLVIGLPFMLDGGLSVLKITIGRVSNKLFHKKVIILKKVLTPVHDHLKQVKGFSARKTWIILTTSAVVVDVAYIILCLIVNLISKY